jgi:hypothetical protein
MEHWPQQIDAMVPHALPLERATMSSDWLAMCGTVPFSGVLDVSRVEDRDPTREPPVACKPSSQCSELATTPQTPLVSFSSPSCAAVEDTEQVLSANCLPQLSHSGRVGCQPTP